MRDYVSSIFARQCAQQLNGIDAKNTARISAAENRKRRLNDAASVSRLMSTGTRVSGICFMHGGTHSSFHDIVFVVSILFLFLFGSALPVSRFQFVLRHLFVLDECNSRRKRNKREGIIDCILKDIG